MKRVFLLITLSTILSCSKEQSERWIQGQLIIKETGQSLNNFEISFDVIEGGGGCLGALGCSGTLVEEKYHAISDNTGHFSFKIDRDDKGKVFHLHPDYYYCDSLRYYTLSNWGKNSLSKHENTTLYFSPTGFLDFYASDTTFNDLGVDTILVKSKYATDTLFKPGWRNMRLNIEPNEMHTFTYLAIKNNQTIKEASKNIYVVHPCSNLWQISDYEVKFN